MYTLLWTLKSLPEGEQLLAEISDPDKQKLVSLARRAISEVSRQPRYLQHLFGQLLSQHPIGRALSTSRQRDWELLAGLVKWLRHVAPSSCKQMN